MDLAKRLSPALKISLPNSLRSGFSRSKSMGMAVTVVVIGLIEHRQRLVGERRRND